MSLYRGTKKIAGLYRGEDVTHATEEHAGIIEIADAFEATEGSNDTKALTPLKAKQVYAKKSDIPTKTSQLTNDSKFITKAVNDLENYYSKTETYTKTETKGLIDAIKTVQIEVVEKLPTEGKENIIYFIKKQDEKEMDIYDEYVYVNKTYELIGNTKVDLTDYAKKSDIFDIHDYDYICNGYTSYASGSNYNAFTLTSGDKTYGANEEELEKFIGKVIYCPTDIMRSTTVIFKAGYYKVLKLEHYDFGYTSGYRVVAETNNEEYTRFYPIYAKADDITDTYSSTSSKAMSGKAVASALAGQTTHTIKYTSASGASTSITVFGK